MVVPIEGSESKAVDPIYHRVFTTLEILKNWKFLGKLNSLLEILDISWNLMAPLGNFCVIDGSDRHPIITLGSSPLFRENGSPFNV